MSPLESNYNAVIFDDDEMDAMLLKTQIERFGWNVVGIAKTYEDAMVLITQLEALKVQKAFIDGNLTPGETTGSEGERIAAAIHEQSPHIDTIGYSARENQGIIKTKMGKNNTHLLPRILSKNNN